MNDSHCILALDIGGANIKAVFAAPGQPPKAISHPFALWRQPQQLASQLQAIASRGPAFDTVLVTMTGELCDCFQTKRQGVAHILDAVQKMAHAKPVRVWLTTGEFASPAYACEQPTLCAASNWHALASYVATLCPDQPAMLIDIGSTTTDILALNNSKIIPAGLTDTQRLVTGELLYLGAARTPLMALGPTIAWHNQTYGICAEWFATMQDLGVLCNWITEDRSDKQTPDHQPRTKKHAARRLLRMISSDSEHMSLDDAIDLAGDWLNSIEHRIARQVLHVANQQLPSLTPRQVIVCGSGAFLARRAGEIAFADVPIIAFESLMGNADAMGRTQHTAQTRLNVSTAACAYALTQLYLMEATHASSA